MARNIADSAVRAGLAALLLCTLAHGPVQASGVAAYHDTEESGRLSANQYVTFDPLIIPMVDNGEHDHQLTLIVAVEFGSQSDREKIRRLTPLLRNEMYETLFRLVTYRTASPRVPPDFILRDRLFNVVRRVAGADHVKSLVIRQAEVGRVR